MVFKRIRPVALALAAAAVVLPSQQASAQFFLFDLFGAEPEQPRQQGARLVPFSRAAEPGQIFVSFSDRQLYYILDRGRAIAYPVAAPRPQDAWQGVMTISQKRENPTWTPTPEMRRENPNLPDVVPGGHPRNPLGPHALYLGSSLYRIHGTDAPWTIGQPVSRGCVRMHNRDVADLYARVGVGTKVTVTYQSFRPRQEAMW